MLCIVSISVLLLHANMALSMDYSDGSCVLPESWRGSWFEAGYPEILINGSAINVKGRCLESDGESRFLFEDRDNCYRCLFIVHQKHANVLQYKETYCEERDTLLNLCSLIPGDGQLHSMFRRDAHPVECPFRGQFTFTYSRGHGECKSPVSRLDSCTEPSKLILRYQACPDVYATESIVEQLQCLAVWKEGSTRYLVGRLDYHGATSDEDRYRCFVYERVGKEPQRPTVLLAQSGDATCSGLTTATEGSRTLRITKAETEGRRCRFPPWLSSHPHWQTLDGRWTYSLHRNVTLRITNATGHAATSERYEQKMTCYSLVDVNEDDARIVAHVSSGCNNGYVCLALFRRQASVVEFQIGDVSPAPEEACTSHYFSPTPGHFKILSSNSHQSITCPLEGRFAVNANPVMTTTMCKGRQMDVSSPFSFSGAFLISSGCSSHDSVHFHDICERETSIGFQCRGTWNDNEDPGTKFLVLTPSHRYSHQGIPRRLCITLVQLLDSWQWTLSSESCLRPRDSDTSLYSSVPQFVGPLRNEFNTTYIGQCTGVEAPVRDSRIVQASSSACRKHVSLLLSLLLFFVHRWR